MGRRANTRVIPFRLPGVPLEHGRPLLAHTPSPMESAGPSPEPARARLSLVRADDSRPSEGGETGAPLLPRIAAGDELGAEITTDGSWDGTSSDLVVSVWALLYLDGV